MKELNDIFTRLTPSRILDVGTGTGDFIQILMESFPSASFTGVDPSGNALAQARLRFPSVSFFQMSGENLEFEAKHFDLVSISMALHHLEDPGVTFDEVKRVMQEGAWLVVNELYSDNLSPAQEVHKMYHHFRSRTDRLKGICHNPTFARNEIISMVDKAGFRLYHRFDYQNTQNLIVEEADVDKRVKKMEEMLIGLEGHAEYDQLKKIIGDFRDSALKFGLVPASQVVMVCSL